MSTSIPQTMRAAVLLDTHHAEVREVPVPKPGKGQVLVKVNKVGVCASDLHLARGDLKYLKMADHVKIGGHEGSGEIVALGEGVDASRWHLKDRVAVRWLSTVCRACEYCKTSYENLCPHRTISGKDLDGCFAQYAIADAGYLARIPQGVSDTDAAPILCAGVTVYKALKVAKVPEGGWVAIVGAGGGLGHLAVQYAKAINLRVLAVDGGAVKGDLCRNVGADKYIDFTQSKDIVADIIKETDGGAHCALLTASSARAYTDAPKYLRRAGCLVCVGLPPVPVQIPVGPEDFVGRGIRIFGTSTGGIEDTEEALDLVAQGKVRPHCVERKMEDLAAIYDELEGGKVEGRYVLDVNK